MTTVSYGMPAKHVKAHLLVELMIALVVISIVIPLVLPWQQQVKGIQMRQLPAVQQHAEMIDQYTTILRDVPKLQTQVSDCCFNTATHTLCYDIKNGQFRRKKATIRNTVLHSQRGAEAGAFNDHMHINTIIIKRNINRVILACRLVIFTVSLAAWPWFWSSHCWVG